MDPSGYLMAKEQQYYIPFTDPSFFSHCHLVGTLSEEKQSPQDVGTQENLVKQTFALIVTAQNFTVFIIITTERLHLEHLNHFRAKRCFEIVTGSFFCHFVPLCFVF